MIYDQTLPFPTTGIILFSSIADQTRPQSHMKRLNTSDDDDFVSIGTEEKRSKKKKGQIYSREFQAMLDGLDDQDDGEAEEMGVAVGAGDKKRRLSSEQVKALEKSFEVENKLEPERKNQLAEELGLEPRQVAIWFQNRRARFKTKQLERDYGVLKADYDSLNLDFDHLQQENQALLAEVRELKMKLNQEIADSNVVLYAAAAAAAKEEEEEEDQSPASESVTTAGVAINGVDILAHAIKEDPTTQYDDGKLIASFHQNSSPFLNWIHFSNSRAAAAAEDEQQSFGNTEESCNFFSVDHAPTLHRYFPH